MGRPPKSPMKVGNRYGRLVAIKFVDYDAAYSRSRWLFRCDCGNEAVVFTTSVRRGLTQSCGCLHEEVLARARGWNASHKMTGSAEYRCWNALLNRCRNKNNKDYARYGGRGIKVCARWLKFENFYADMGPRPSPAHSIDRYPDKNGDYAPSNCRWATAKEQANNRRVPRRGSTIFVTFKGKRTSLISACEQSGVKYVTAYWRLAHGWPLNRVFKT